LLPSGKGVGVDVGLQQFATLSTGTQIANPHLYCAAERKLQRAQRRLARWVKGSKPRRKARELPAKAHLRVRRARLDFAHKTARALVIVYDQIVVERLNITVMVRNHPLAKSISDAGWSFFVNVLRAQAASAGRVVLEVTPQRTSQTCSQCGQHVPKRLAVRWQSYSSCGCELHRNHNAAFNILQNGGGTARNRKLVANGARCSFRCWTRRSAPLQRCAAPSYVTNDQLRPLPQRVQDLEVDVSRIAASNSLVPQV
jgi:putative transposase